MVATREQLDAKLAFKFGNRLGNRLNGDKLHFCGGGKGAALYGGREIADLTNIHGTLHSGGCMLRSAHHAKQTYRVSVLKVWGLVRTPDAVKRLFETIAIACDCASDRLRAGSMRKMRGGGARKEV